MLEKEEHRAAKQSNKNWCSDNLVLWWICLEKRGFRRILLAASAHSAFEC
jgi:hypothetical protein